MNPAAPAIAGHSRPALAGLMMLLCGAVLKATTSFDPFPGWGGDPTSVAVPILGLTPAMSIAVDALIFLGALITIHTCSRSRPLLWQAACFFLGSAAAVAHARMIDGGSLDNLMLASSWISSLAAGLAVSQACRDDALKRVVVAVTVGLIVALAAKGAMQVLIEHPRTVQWFKENREQILTAQGWSLDSAMARNYERRLYQSEASGWFGLSNVYATFAAGCSVSLVGLTVVAARCRAYAHRPLAIAALCLGAASGIAALAMAGSKGGFAAFGLGLFLLVLSRLLRAPRMQDSGARIAGLIGPAIIAAALLAVIARGLVGERIGELSLLFRWFYMQGATHIFADHWLLGVGPADFKDAYMIAKPATSPEDVSSPHSILLDWLATLGLGGLAWCVLFLVWSSAAGRALAVRADSQPPQPQATTPLRPELRASILALIVPMLLAAWLERPAATIDSTLVRLVGMVGSAAVASAVIVLMRSVPIAPIAAAIGAGALAMATHCQIELTATTPPASPWLFIFVAGAGSLLPCAAKTASRARTWITSGLLVVLAFAVWTSLPTIVRWELLLRDAARTVQDLPDLAQRQSALAGRRWQPTPDGDSAKRLADSLSDLLGRPVGASPNEIERSFVELQVQQAALAAGYLDDAQHAIPTHSATAHALSSLWLDAAQRASALGRAQDAKALVAKAEDDALRAISAGTPRASEFGWLGTVLRAKSQLHSAPATLEAAVSAWEHAASLAPHELLFPLQLVDAYQQLGRNDQASVWAGRALRINDQLRLDPLKQLSPTEKSRLEAAAASRDGPRPPP